MECDENRLILSVGKQHSKTAFLKPPQSPAQPHLLCDPLLPQLLATAPLLRFPLFVGEKGRIHLGVSAGSRSVGHENERNEKWPGRNVKWTSKHRDGLLGQAQPTSGFFPKRARLAAGVSSPESRRRWKDWGGVRTNVARKGLWKFRPCGAALLQKTSRWSRPSTSASLDTTTCNAPPELKTLGSRPLHPA